MALCQSSLPCHLRWFQSIFESAVQQSIMACFCSCNGAGAPSRHSAYSRSCPGPLGTNSPHLSGRTTHQAYGPQELVIPQSLKRLRVFAPKRRLTALGRSVDVRLSLNGYPQRPRALPPMGLLFLCTTSQSRLENKSIKVTLGGNRTNSRSWHLLVFPQSFKQRAIDKSPNPNGGPANPMTGWSMGQGSWK